MLRSPQVVAIDDELEHLAGLIEGFSRYGTTCLPIHFTADTECIQRCPDVRVIFIDLHLLAGTPPGNYTQNFSIIASLIKDNIKPSGPYFIVLWTMHPEEVGEFQRFLEERPLTTAKPFAIKSLNKDDHLDDNGNVKNIDKLCKSITSVIDEQPQIGALLDWEHRVLGATADTVSSIVNLAESAPGAQSLCDEVGRLLANLANATVGNEHVEENRFRAVNEALLPILADRIASIQRSTNDTAWINAFSKDADHELSMDEAAKLNGLLHIASSTETSRGSERGAVIALPQNFLDGFKQTFGLTQEDAAKDSYFCRNFDPNNADLPWVLVQSQAVCDYVQGRQVPVPYHLGLVLPPDFQIKGSRPPTALWVSPCFENGDGIRHLHVNAGFQRASPSAYSEERPLFRLREQILNDLIYRLHSHSARPGIISFHKTRQRSGN